MKYMQDRPVFVIVLLSLTLFAFGASAETITLVADEWCPYNCEPGSDAPGFMVEIAQYAFERAGHAVTYQVLPWSRAVPLTRKGKFHGVIGALKGDAPDFVFPENELAITNNTFFVHTDSTWEFRTLQDLEHISLGIIANYSYSDAVDAYIQNQTQNQNGSEAVQVVFGENALKINVGKLLAGRIDALLEDPMVMNYYLRQSRQNGMLKNAGSISSTPLYIAFSPAFPNSKDYAVLLSNAVQELRESGQLHEILAKYGLEDWK